MVSISQKKKKKIKDRKQYLRKAATIAKPIADKKFSVEGVITLNDITYHLRNINLNDYIHLYHKTIRVENINTYLLSLGAFKTKDRLRILNREVFECYLKETHPDITDNEASDILDKISPTKANITKIIDEDKVIKTKLSL